MNSTIIIEWLWRRKDFYFFLSVIPLLITVNSILGSRMIGDNCFSNHFLLSDLGLPFILLWIFRVKDCGANCVLNYYRLMQHDTSRDLILMIASKQLVSFIFDCFIWSKYKELKRSILFLTYVYFIWIIYIGIISKYPCALKNFNKDDKVFTVYYKSIIFFN